MKIFVRILGALGVLLVLAVGVLAIVISRNAPCEPPLAATGDSRAALVSCYGGPEVIQIAELAKPVPGPGEVLVRIHAAAVNPLDWHYLRGTPYLMRLMSGLGSPDDRSVGVDFAGVIEAVGDDVTRFAPGDEVFGGRSGAFADYLVMPADRAIAKKPANVSFADAAAVPIAAITALQALRDLGEIRTGERVLINGASGGVGTYAVQIAKAMGAEVHGVCSTRNVDMVTGIGADHVFDYKKEDYTTDDVRFDLIVDMVGNHSLGKNRSVLTDAGRIVLVGGDKGNWIAPLKGPLAAMATNPFSAHPAMTLLAEMNAEDLEVLAELMASGAVRSVLDQRYPLEQLADAISYSETGRARGKIIIELVPPTEAS